MGLRLFQYENGFRNYQHLYRIVKAVDYQITKIEQSLEEDANYIDGSYNALKGNGNVIIGDYNHVEGDLNWVLSKEDYEGEINNFLIFERWEINLNKIELIKYSPHKVIRNFSQDDPELEIE